MLYNAPSTDGHDKWCCCAHQEQYQHQLNRKRLSVCECVWVVYAVWSLWICGEVKNSTLRCSIAQDIVCLCLCVRVRLISRLNASLHFYIRTRNLSFNIFLRVSPLQPLLSLTRNRFKFRYSFLCDESTHRIYLFSMSQCESNTKDCFHWMRATCSIKIVK